MCVWGLFLAVLCGFAALVSYLLPFLIVLLHFLKVALLCSALGGTFLLLKAQEINTKLYIRTRTQQPRFCLVQFVHAMAECTEAGGNRDTQVPPLSMSSLTVIKQ